MGGWPRSPTLGGETLVDRSHGARSLADGGGDSLQRSVAHVTGGEPARYWRLARKRIGCAGRRVRQLAIGEHESASVEQHVGPQPAGLRRCADEAEQPRAGDRLLLAGCVLVDRPLPTVILAGQPLYFDTGEEVNFWIGLDPLDQVLRHALREIAAADRERDLAVVLSQVDRRLSGRVPAPDP